MRAAPSLLWLALLLMWLALNRTLSAGDVIVGALVALGAVRALAWLRPASAGVRRPWVALKLAAAVLADIVRSNLEVAALVLSPAGRGRVAGFVDVPLDTRSPAALAALACIITATPGTAWARYDARANVVTIHVLDLRDGPALVRDIKERYETRVREALE